MLLRVRSRQGTARVQVNDEWSRNELLDALAEVTNIPIDRLKVLSGYPSRPLAMEDGQSVAAVLANGDMLTVEEARDAVRISDYPPSIALPAATPSPEPPRSANGTSSPETAQQPPNSSSIAADGEFVRRVVPDDNSCLFRAVSYVLGQGHAPEFLRAVIAEHVRKNPDFYNEASLGRSNSEYRSWIQRDTSWGGAIELSILAQHFRTELAAFDVKTMRMDCYGEGANYELRGYLLYDGIHYDALALALGGEAVRDLDVTLFACGDSVAQAKARALAQRENSRKAYTDTQSFKLKCQDCGKILYGEKAATDHAKSTAHANFVEG
mmetsp:Transcript_7756/g.23471  ORF Transcript_7756/g.23471 Transcript_7756/m.23471 type:complete len:324 (-) Transcript_7756:1102-2073(-)